MKVIEGKPAQYGTCLSEAQFVREVEMKRCMEGVEKPLVPRTLPITPCEPVAGRCRDAMPTAVPMVDKHSMTMLSDAQGAQMTLGELFLTAGGRQANESDNHK